MNLAGIIKNHMPMKDGHFAPEIMESILDAAGVPINYCGSDLVIRYANFAHAALHGLTPDHVIGKHIVDILGVEGNEAIRPYYERALRGEQVKYELEVNFLIGKRYIECIYNPVYDDENTIVGWVGVIINMTQRHELEKALIENEENLRQAKEKAEAANIAKSEFLSNMSHELRTPMNAVIGITDILLMQNHTPERQKEYLETLQISGTHLMHIINDVLDIAKLDMQQVVFEAIPFNLTTLLDEVVRITAVQAKAKGISVQLREHCPAGSQLVGDPLRLRQILMNLLGNAVKFTDKGSVTVETDCPHNPETNMVDLHISVVDTGIGIAADKVDSIFGKFSQADASITRKYGGTGLGLSICSTLVEQMNGTICVESKPGEGSRFTIRISLPTHQDEIQPAAEEGLFDISKTKQYPDLKVLLAEDTAANILVATTLLEIFGCKYEVAKTGKEVFEMLAKHQFDLALMDVQMPDMDGFQVTEEIRRQEAESGSPRLPIIAMTAHALVGDKQRCLARGMDDYIPKPFDMNHLSDILGRYSKLKKTSA